MSTAIILHSLGYLTWSGFVLRFCAGCARPRFSAAALGFPLSRLRRWKVEILGFAVEKQSHAFTSSAAGLFRHWFLASKKS